MDLNAKDSSGTLFTVKLVAVCVNNKKTCSSA